MSYASVLAVIFWLGVAATLYAYVLFPLLNALIGRHLPHRRPPNTSAPPEAVVTVIVPAYNEERSLEAKLANVLASDYPADLLDVIVVSDASTDGTDAIARRFGADGVRLIVQEKRAGKTAGLNRAVAAARGEIVVFTDANASFPRETITTLAAYLDDRRVGLVSGFTRYTVSNSGRIAEATNAYTLLERVIKRGESRSGCCVGADGAIFAMRRSLFRRLRDDDINDLVLPLAVIDQGYDCVFAEDAFCTEHPGKSLDSEFRRQSRITNRTLRALWRHAHLLNPFRFPRFAFFLFSHKVVRFLVPVLLVLSAVALLVLAPQGGIFGALGIVALLVLGLTAIPKRTPLRFIHVFVTINVAMLDGWRKFLAGRGEVTWQHDRSSAANEFQ